MSFTLNRAVVRFVRACPVTTAVMVLAVALAAGESLYRLTLSDSAGSRHALGGVARLTYTAVPQLHGPLALWQGEWWRIPVSAFHHGGASDRPFDPLQWLHLGLNCLALGYLGGLLEPRMRGSVYFLLVVAALFVPLLPEFLLEEYVSGLSGLACALFGALLVLRRRDAEVAEALPPGVIGLAFAWLWLCVPLTVLEIVPIANVGHFSGLAYGWLAGQVLFGSATALRWRMVFVAAHLAIAPAVYLAVHPVWIGRYHWHLALGEPDLEQRAGHWKRAVERDPSLEQLWWSLAGYDESRGRPLDAWRTVLAGLDANRTSERGDQVARQLWRKLRGDEALRGQARQLLAERFGPEESAWRERLGIPPARVEVSGDIALPGELAARASEAEPDVSRYRLDRRIDLAPAETGTAAPRDLSAPPFDEDDPESAVLGRRL